MKGKIRKLNIQVGRKIMLERLKRDLSQEKLAKMSELSKNALGAIERGTSVPTINTLDKIAFALKMQITELLDVSKVNL